MAPKPLAPLVFLITACQPPAIEPWHEARQACELAEGEHPVDTVIDGRPALDLSPECSLHLGELLGVDRESFEAAPLSLEALLHGAHLLVAADFGEVGQLLASPHASTWARQHLARQAERGGLSDRAPASALLLAHVRSELREIRFVPDLEQYAAAYDRGRMVLGEVQSHEDQPPLWMASVLMHEASHGVGPEHGACRDRPDEACDADLDGVYGAQAWMIEAWRQGLQPGQAHAEEACAGSVSDLTVICSMVNNPGDDLLCDPLARWRVCDTLGQR